MFIALTDEGTTGREELDDQHQEAMDAANAIVAATSEHAPQRVADALEKLAHTMAHIFEAEEQRMDAMGFPWLAAHQRAHRQIVAEVHWLLHTLATGAPVGTVQLRLHHIFQNQYLPHVKRADTRLIAWHQRRQLPAEEPEELFALPNRPFRTFGSPASQPHGARCPPVSAHHAK